MVGIKIEKLKIRDMEQYKSLIDKCFGNSHDLTEYLNSYSEDEEAYLVFVAKEENKIIGSMTCYTINLFTFSFQPALELFNVAVLEEYRRQNVAKILFEKIKEFASVSGYRTIYLTCLDTAFSAHEFYESVGLEKMNSLKYNMKL